MGFWIFLEEILFFIIFLFNFHGKPCFHILNPIGSWRFQAGNITKYSPILVINLIFLGFLWSIFKAKFYVITSYFFIFYPIKHQIWL